MGNKDWKLEGIKQSGANDLLEHFKYQAVLVLFLIISVST